MEQLKSNNQKNEEIVHLFLDELEKLNSIFSHMNTTLLKIEQHLSRLEQIEERLESISDHLNTDVI